MRLTLYSDFALRTLIFLAVADERGATIPEIAAAYAISENHLRKVVGRLIENGFVEATRGRGGGLRLAVPASQISIGAAVRKLESDFALAECMGVAPENCVITGRCGLQQNLQGSAERLLPDARPLHARGRDQWIARAGTGARDRRGSNARAVTVRTSLYCEILESERSIRPRLSRESPWPREIAAASETRLHSAGLFGFCIRAESFR